MTRRCVGIAFLTLGMGAFRFGCWPRLVTAFALAFVVGCAKEGKPAAGSEPGPAVEPHPPPEIASEPEAKPPGVEQRLYAEGVDTDSIELSISIETLGGVATVLIPSGTHLPAVKREIFSTASDNQTSVEIHPLQGEKPMAKDNHSLGSYRVEGIKPAPRGVPQIEVSFAVDTSGVFTLSARDLDSKSVHAVVVTKPSEGPIGTAEIERLRATAPPE